MLKDKRLEWVLIVFAICVAATHQPGAKGEDLRIETLKEHTNGESRVTILTGSGEIVAEVVKRDRDGDGKLDSTHDSTTRKVFFNGVRMLTEVQIGTNGPSRYYGKPGELWFIELDEDSDGFFETVIVFRNHRRIVCVLSRNRNGGFEPASSDKVQHVLATWARFDRTVEQNGEQLARKVIERKLDLVRETILSSGGEKIVETVLRNIGYDATANYSLTKLFVDGVRVYVEVRPDTNAPFRTYGKAGELFLIEEDEDMDGFFETLIVYGKGKNIAAVLSRTKDGNIEVASKEKAQLILESQRAFDNTVRPIMEEMLRGANHGVPDSRQRATGSK